jgi:hypothetical protein
VNELHATDLDLELLAAQISRGAGSPAPMIPDPILRHEILTALAECARGRATIARLMALSNDNALLVQRAQETLAALGHDQDEGTDPDPL